MEYFIGTSGWQYPHWKEVFYPVFLRQDQWLSYYTNFFNTVEVNVTFYRDVKETTIKRWVEVSPEGFLFSIKMSRFITHIKRLRVERESLIKFLNKAEAFGKKCGVILIQLPPSLKFDLSIMEDFLSLLDPKFRYTIEPRNKTFLDDRFFDLLERKRVAFCISDSAGRYPYFEATTTDFIYIRLHGSKILYGSSYTQEELRRWKEKILEWQKTTFVYFDNDYMGFAVKNALSLKKMMMESL